MLGGVGAGTGNRPGYPISSGFRAGFVLVLSIAVLVLVLDSILRYPGGSLDQSSQHRYDLFQVRFSKLVRIISNRIADTQHVVN